LTLALKDGREITGLMAKWKGYLGYALLITFGWRRIRPLGFSLPSFSNLQGAFY